MGSTPHAHAQANVKTPHEQGVVAMISVFIDTFVVLTLNALVIISTLYTEGGPLANGYVGDVTSQLNSANLAQTASAPSWAPASALPSWPSACSSSPSPPSWAGTCSARSTSSTSSARRAP